MKDGCIYCNGNYDWTAIIDSVETDERGEESGTSYVYITKEEDNAYLETVMVYDRIIFRSRKRIKFCPMCSRLFTYKKEENSENIC